MALTVAITITSCNGASENSTGGDSNGNNPNEISVTGTATDITEFTAKITGYANKTDDLGYVTMGILVSTDENPTFDNGMRFTSQELDDNNMYTVHATGLAYNTVYYYKSFVLSDGVSRSGKVKTFTTTSDISVDLGLSVKWSACNIGAFKPEEYGDYYAWGETETKSYYDLSTYKWYNDSYSTFTKYNTSSSYGTVDNKTVLEPEDDVAHVELGGKWRLPTSEEWNELITSCTWSWTAIDSKVDGYVSGYVITSNKTDNSIFLPKTPYRYSISTLFGKEGRYWSSSLDIDSPSAAWACIVEEEDVHMDTCSRIYGHSIRPVLAE